MKGLLNNGRRILALSLIVLFLPGVVQAYRTYFNFDGTVTWNSNPVQGANVTIDCVYYGIEYSRRGWGISDANGYYSINEGPMDGIMIPPLCYFETTHPYYKTDNINGVYPPTNDETKTVDDIILERLKVKIKGNIGCSKGINDRINNLVVERMYEGRGWNSDACSTDGKTYSCSVHAGRYFRLRASAPLYNTLYYPSSIAFDSIPSEEVHNLYLERINLTVPVNIWNSTGSQIPGSQLSISGRGNAGGCTGSDGSYTCTVYSGAEFNLIASHDWYETDDNLYTRTSTSPIDITLTKKPIISGNLSPNAGESMSQPEVNFTYDSGLNNNSCSVSYVNQNWTYACRVNLGNTFELRASALNHDYKSLTYLGGIFSDIKQDIILNRTLLVLNGTITGDFETPTGVTVQYLHNLTGQSWQDCAYTDIDYACPIYSGVNFRVNASAPHYNTTYYPGISEWTNITINNETPLELTRSRYTITGNVSPEIGTIASAPLVNYSHSSSDSACSVAFVGSNWTYNCNDVYSGKELNLTIKADHHEFQKITDYSVTGITTDVVKDVLLLRTILSLSGTITGDFETPTGVTVQYLHNLTGQSWQDCAYTDIDYACPIYSGVNFRVNASAPHYNITYQPSISTWSNINNNQTSPLELKRLVYPVNVNITNSTGGSITGSSANYTYDEVDWFECPSHVCQIYSNKDFRIKAQALFYIDNTSPWLNIDNTSPIVVNGSPVNLTLYRDGFDVDFNITNSSGHNLPGSQITTNGPGSGGSCTGSDGEFTCFVYSGLAFNATAINTGYITKENTYTKTDNTAEIIELDDSLRIEFTNTKPAIGVINASPYQINIQDNYNENGIYCIPADPANNPYTVKYIDLSGRYSSDNQSPINVNESSQAVVTLDINTVVHNQNIALSDEDLSTAISDATVNASYDGMEHSCTNNGGGSYTCLIPNNTLYNVKAIKDGYITKGLHSSPQILLSDNSSPLQIQRTLGLFIEDDNSEAVNSGTIIINDSANTNTLYQTDLTGNSETYFYYPLTKAQGFNIYYTGGNYYTDYSVEGQSIDSEPTSQKSLAINPNKTWPTSISVSTPTGSLNGYSVKLDGQDLGKVSSTVLDRYQHQISVNKTGFTLGSTTVNDNQGSTINFNINQTLMVNVTDDDGDPASGKIIVKDEYENVINTMGLSNGIAWVPVDPSKNDRDLTVIYESTKYIDDEKEINHDTLSDAQTHYMSFQTQNSTGFTVTVKDRYTKEEINDSNIRVYDKTTTYCTQSECDFDTEDIPNEINITVNKEGYYEKKILNQPTGVQEYTINIKPTAIIFLNTKATISVISTKGTSSLLDDEEILTAKTVNKTASLPIDFSDEFLLKITADDYYKLVIGPLIIGDSTLELIEDLEPLPLFPPVITSTSYSPLNPEESDNITISITATDEDGGRDLIEICYYRIDNSTQTFSLDSDYNDYTITANKMIGNLTSGVHEVKVSCSDINQSKGPESIITIQVGDISPEEPEINETILLLKRLEALRRKYEVVIKTGLNTPRLIELMNEAEAKINTLAAERALNNAEFEMPEITLIEETTVKTTASSNPEQIALKVIEIEDQPYTEEELKKSIKKLPYTKTARKYTVDGQEKSIITLRVLSTENKPDAVIADFNPGSSSAPTTVTTNDGSITYFKGLSSGENVFEYIIEGEVSETLEPVVFTMKELSRAEKTIKNITGLTIGLPGVIEVPVVFVGIGAIILLVLKFLI